MPLAASHLSFEEYSWEKSVGLYLKLGGLVAAKVTMISTHMGISAFHPVTAEWRECATWVSLDLDPVICGPSDLVVHNER